MRAMPKGVSLVAQATPSVMEAAPGEECERRRVVSVTRIDQKAAGGRTRAEGRRQARGLRRHEGPGRPTASSAFSSTSAGVDGDRATRRQTPPSPSLTAKVTPSTILPCGST